MSLFGDQNVRLKQRVLKTERRKQQLQAEKREAGGLTSDRKISFDSLSEPLAEKTLRALEKMQITELTEVQASMIPIVRTGDSLHMTARTGSGKTLGYAIPLLELLNTLKFHTFSRTGAVVLCPTRELCLQTFGVLKSLVQFYSYSVEVLIGGEAQFLIEQKFLTRGVTIIVCTPTRFLQHLNKTEGFKVEHIISVVFDEADRLLETYQKDLIAIEKLIPKQNQMVLVSATKDPKAVEYGKERVLPPFRWHSIDLHEDETAATAKGLTQNYLEYSMENKFWFLRWLLEKLQREKKKVLVFFNSCESVNYFCRILAGYCINNSCIHGEMRQRVRTRTYNIFSKVKSGILLCTSLAERGLDIFGVDYVLQYDPPRDCEEYIHRVGRTARNGAKGEALMLLQDHELGFVEHLAKKKIFVGCNEMTWDDLEKKQQQFEHQLKVSRPLRSIAVDAFYAYLTAYRLSTLKKFFDHKKLNLPKIAKSFGLYKVLAPNKGKWMKPLDQDGFITKRPNSLKEVSNEDKKKQIEQIHKRKLQESDNSSRKMRKFN